jgi:hypothetical protein
MAHKILTTVYDTIGNEYTTDVHVSYRSQDVDLMGLDNLMARGRLTFHKSLEHKNQGFSSFEPIINSTELVTIHQWQKQITVEEAALVNPTTIHGYITEYLKGIYGEDNVVVV